MDGHWYPLALVLLGLLGCATPHGARQRSLSDPAPVLTALDGKPSRLFELRGRVVLLDFWATWCEPCKATLPAYNAWQLEHGRDRLVVVVASEDEEDTPLEAFIRQHAPDVVVVRDPQGEVAARLGLTALPTAYLFDREGHLAGAYPGARAEDLQALRAEIARLLSPSSPSGEASFVP